MNASESKRAVERRNEWLLANKNNNDHNSNIKEELIRFIHSVGDVLRLKT